MNCYKNDIENAILFFAKLYGKEKGYEAMLTLHTSTLPKLVEMITYELFLQKFCYYNCAEEQYNQYKIILEYATELAKNGFVEFNTLKEHDMVITKIDWDGISKGSRGTIVHCYGNKGFEVEFYINGENYVKTFNASDLEKSN